MCLCSMHSHRACSQLRLCPGTRLSGNCFMQLNGHTAVAVPTICLLVALAILLCSAPSLAIPLNGASSLAILHCSASILDLLSSTHWPYRLTVPPPFVNSNTHWPYRLTVPPPLVNSKTHWPYRLPVPPPLVNSYTH